MADNNHRRKNESTYEDRLMASWLRILFWLFILSTVASIITYDAIVQILPVLYVPGMILGAASTLAYGYVLIRLKPVDSQYNTAGICTLLAGAINLILSGNSSISAGWALMLTVTTSFINFVGTYNEMTAHDIVLIEKNFDLSEKWTALRKWYMIVFLATMGSLLLLLLVPTVGTVFAMISSLGMIVISVLKVICLYRTAQVFQDITA